MKPSATPGNKPTFTHELMDDDKTMPLGVGESGEDSVLDPLASTGSSRRFRSGSLLLVLVIGLSAGGLWFMRSLAHVSGATSVKSEAEETIEKFLGARDKKPAAGANSDPLAVLASTYTDRQVPLDSVKANPFIMPGEGEPRQAVVAQPGEDPEKAKARMREARTKDINAAAERLAIKSIILGSQPIANISGTIVREGDELAPEGSDVTFIVQKITADTITLVATDMALGLRVEAPISMKRDR